MISRTKPAGMRPRRTLRAVALFEAAKGVLVVLAGLGALSVIDHRDAQRLAEELVGHLHLNPASHYPRIFIDAAESLTDARLWLLAALAAAYASGRFVEAYGLWRGKRWAQWFAAVCGGIYIPFELHHLFKDATWLSFGALLVNVLIVGLMVNALRRQPVTEGARYAEVKCSRSPSFRLWSSGCGKRHRRNGGLNGQLR